MFVDVSMLVLVTVAVNVRGRAHDHATAARIFVTTKHMRSVLEL